MDIAVDYFRFLFRKPHDVFIEKLLLIGVNVNDQKNSAILGQHILGSAEQRVCDSVGIKSWRLAVFKLKLPEPHTACTEIFTNVIIA